jgi:hypothetical protein
VQCRYCGTIVVVPEGLRIHPTLPPQPERLIINVQPFEAAPLRSVRGRRGTPGVGCGGCGCFASLLFVVAFAGFMIYIFGFSIKGSVMYTCAVEKAKSNAQVVKQIGTPIKAGTFAWITNYESSGSDETGHFTTLLSGSKGSGTLDVYGSHNRRSTDLDVTFDSNGETVQVYSGSAQCK